MKRVEQLLHVIALFLARRNIASALSGFEKAQAKLESGVTAIEGAIDRVQTFVKSEEQKAEEVIAKAKQRFAELEAAESKRLTTMAIEKDRAAKVAQNFKKLIEA